MTSVSFSICSLIYIIIFNVVYFGKKRINLEENKVYSTLLITTTLGLIIDIIGYISFKKLEMDSIFNITISKLYLIYYFTWAFEITVYTNIISFKKSIKRLMNKIWIFYIAICLIIFILPRRTSKFFKSIINCFSIFKIICFLSTILNES